MKETIHDTKTRRILSAGFVLILICIVCIFISIRFVGKYRDKVAESSMLEQKLEELKLETKELDIKIKELQVIRYDLSLEKEQISKDYSTIKNNYVALGKTIKKLEGDIHDLQKILNYDGNNVSNSVPEDGGNSEIKSQIMALQSQNNRLRKELTSTTKEKMILRIALESQAKRLGLSENYDPELKKIIKDFVTSLQ